VTGRGCEEGVRPLGIELEGHAVERSARESGPQRRLQVDHVSHPHEESPGRLRSFHHGTTNRDGPLLPSGRLTAIALVRRPLGSSFADATPLSATPVARAMPWTLLTIPSAKRTELDAALHDDLVSRQSQKVRAASAFGGPADATYVLVEGSSEAVRRADELLGPLATPLAAPEKEALYRRLKEEDDAASAGMGLFFTED
jgi:hypothetical protein